MFEHSSRFDRGISYTGGISLALLGHGRALCGPYPRRPLRLHDGRPGAWVHHRDGAGLQGRRGQGTRHLWRRADAGGGVSVDIQPGDAVQDAFAPPDLSPGYRRSGRDTAIRLLSPAPRLSAASPRTDSKSRAANAAKLPAAARNHTGPALSAREASTSPTVNSTALRPFIPLTAFLSPKDAPLQMLAPRSDKKARRGRACVGPFPGGAGA